MKGLGDGWLSGGGQAHALSIHLPTALPVLDDRGGTWRISQHAV